MGNVARRASLYTDTGAVENGARVLTRGKNDRTPETGLKDRAISMIAGNLFVANLRDLTKRNEAYLEVTVVTSKGKDSIPHAFKQQIDVKDDSFSSDVQGRELLSGILVLGRGIEVTCKLTELDRIEEDKFKAIKDFVDENEIGDKAQKLLGATGLPVSASSIISTLFSTVKLLDALNDDDRVWSEMPFLSLSSSATYKLFEGVYALVQDPKKSSEKNPMRLYEAGGELYSEYKSDSQNTPFRDEAYLTWSILAD